MPKSTLVLKSSVTRRQAEPIDADERAAQLQHHQAAENAARTAVEPVTIAQAEPTVPKLKVDPHALQSAFLKANLNRAVTVYTINGVKLIGKLRQYDHFTVLLEGPDGVNSLTFKHAISTMAPLNRPHDEATRPRSR
ncbi:MAG TPA: RNA chaperone Hfq, partial [Candidatus Competibacteraceae bacterium]|nr:RNA chaperone Hfq [Candidatus Competibacteraceae bacterium]